MVYSEYPKVFDDLYRLTTMAVTSNIKKLIVTGLPGQGKSHSVETVVNRLVSKSGYKIVSGYSTIKEFYIELYRAQMNDMIEVMIFDDCDKILKDKVGIDILKSVMDTRVSPVCWNSRSTYPSDVLISANGTRNHQLELKLLSNDQIPDSFTYTKTLIFISNKRISEIDSAVVSRCTHIDVSLSRADMFKHMRAILKCIYPQAPINVKEEVLNLIQLNHGSDKVVDLRTLVKGINFAMNDDNWEDLVVKYT